MRHTNIEFQHTLFLEEGSEDVDVVADVDLFTQAADLTSIRSTVTGDEMRLTGAMRQRLETVAVDIADEMWATP